MPKLKIIFACNTMGNISEVWMWRQIIGFNTITPSLLTWNYNNKEIFPLEDKEVYELKEFDSKPFDSNHRWLHRLRCLPQFNFYASIGKEKKQIVNYIAKHKAKCIVAQFGQSGLRLLPIAKLLNIPLIVHFHGLDLSSSLNNPWYRWSLKHNLQYFTHNIVVGSHQEKILISFGVPKDKISLIPCGVPTEEFTAPTIRKSDNDKIKFIAISRLVEKKGIEYTLKAFASIHKKLDNIEFDIYGDGPLRKQLEEMTNTLKINHIVSFKGEVSPDRISKILQSYDIFLQHSITAKNGDQEGFGVSIAEASATGLPVICSNATGIRDQVIDEKTGFLIPEKDATSMAEKMLLLARDQELRITIGKAGRKRMKEHYDSRKQISKLENVIINTIES